MKLALEGHNSLKAYSVLADNFFIKKHDQDLEELKYFNTCSEFTYKNAVLT